MALSSPRVPRRVEAASPTLPLQTVKMRRLGVTNVTSLLRSASTMTRRPRRKPPRCRHNPMCSRPRSLETAIARSLRAVQPRIGIYQGQDDGAPALREERLYLVGLQREDLRAELSSSMEPGGRFLVTILTLLAFLVWPLANLRSKSPDDAIAWSEAVACLAAVVYDSGGAGHRGRVGLELSKLVVVGGCSDVEICPAGRQRRSAVSCMKGACCSINIDRCIAVASFRPDCRPDPCAKTADSSPARQAFVANSRTGLAPSTFPRSVRRSGAAGPIFSSVFAPTVVASAKAIATPSTTRR